MTSITTTSGNTTIKDEDVAFWLHNKLGSHADLWSSYSISSTLTREHLQSIKSIPWSLEALVKVKLLLSFIHVPKRNIAEWGSLMKEIIELIHQNNEDDQWIAVISEIMKTFPDKSLFNLDLSDQECEGYSDGIQELRKTVKKNNDTTHLPLESCYLGRTALKVLTGDIPNPPKCFSLIRKAKSARIRQELLEKSAQASKAKKINEAASLSASRRSIDDHPSYYASNSPTQKQLNYGFLKSNPITASSSGITGTSRSSARREGNVKLLSLEEEQALNDKKRKKQNVDDEEHNNEKKSNRGKKSATQTNSIDRKNSSSGDVLPTETAANKTPEIQRSSMPNRLEPEPPLISPVTYAPLSHNEMPATPNPVMNNSGNDMLYGLSQPRLERQFSAPVTKPAESEKTPTTPVARSDLKLSTEHVNFLRELFRTSPCLTAHDRSRILNFIGGNRDRAADPNKSGLSSPMVTIKLSEQDEIINDPNTGRPQSCFVESFFQMNISTGEWKRVKKITAHPFS